MADDGTDTSLPVSLDVRGRVAVIRLNRPAERNPLTTSVLDTLHRTVSTLRTREDVSALVFTGSGDVFASGADIRELAALDPATAADFSSKGQRLLRLIAESAKPSVAAVDGYCMGGGLDLALACAVRVASPQSVFAHPGARLGIITGWGGTQRLPRLVGPTRALEMFLTARRLTAYEALEFGLIDFIADDPLARALKIADAG